MTMTKVWNLTDAKTSPVKPRVRMVLGRAVKPGRAVQVEETHLEKAHKVRKEVKEKILFIGRRPPAWYTATKKPPRAFADARRVGENGRIDPTEAKTVVAKGHERLPAEAIAGDSAKAVDKATVEESVEESVYTPEPAMDEEPSAETTEEESEESSRKRRRGRR